MVVVGSDKNRGSARRGLFQKEAWDQTLKDANCRHGMDGCLRTSKNNEDENPESLYCHRWIWKGKRYVTCEDGSGERSSRGPSRHRGCRKTGLEGTCGLGGGRGNSRQSRGKI